jgi:hypothetical protein
MLFGLGILATALLLSMVAAYYSVAGLVAIFSAATIPVIIMGGSLELGKIVATVWLHNNWRRAGWAFKAYLIPAVAFLMLLTSMGIFGYLSKAHSDQSLVSGDATARIAIYDEKIRTERENIDANRKALKQLDEAVDQVMGRSTDERGAERSVQIRRSQQAERGRLLKEIDQSQKRIGTLNEERAPLAAEYRKVEAEVGPIKYIAALVYGDSADQNVLEKAVRFVIIMIVLVFDPLALTLILAANKQFEWARQGSGGWVHDEPRYPPDDGPPADSQIEQLKETVETETKEPEYLNRRGFWNKPPGWVSVGPLVAKPDSPPEVPNPEQKSVSWPPPSELWPFPPNAKEDDLDTAVDEHEKAAMRAWKVANPDDTIKRQRTLFETGRIDHLPWDQPTGDLQADNATPLGSMRGFGTAWPDQPIKGDTFLRVDSLPSVLYKFNGQNWIEIDKKLSDQYSYDTAYIEHLISKIESGEYDAELLTEAELVQIEQQIARRNAG